jgi:hypothetical protein
MFKAVPFLATAIGFGAVAASIVSVRVEDVSAPPGGVAQLKVSVTESKPISTAQLEMSFDSSFSVMGVALATGAGDVSGAAVVSKGRLLVSASSPLSSLASDPDYPIFAATVSVSPTAPIGTTYRLNLGSNSWWRNLLQTPYQPEVKPGLLVVEDVVAVSNVVPGGGDLPAGTTVTIHGVGFKRGTRVKINETSITSTKFISSQEIRVKLANATRMDGKEVRIDNRDGNKTSYFSYLRTKPHGNSTNALLARTEPIFALKKSTAAMLGPIVPPVKGFVSVAIQNSQLVPVTVTLSALNSAKTNTVVLQPAERYVRTVSELFGSLPFGSVVSVNADRPIHTLGLINDGVDEAVRPVAFVSVAQ